MKKLFLYCLVQILAFLSVAQSEPLVVLDGYFITRDKEKVINQLGFENISDTTFIPADSAVKLLEEHGKNGLFIITTHVGEKGQATPPPDSYFDVPPLILVDQIKVSHSDLNRINPRDVKSIRIRRPWEIVQIKGLEGVGGIVLISTIKDVPLEEPLIQDSTLTILDKEIKLPTFQLELKLSELAEKELKSSKESIVVVAFFRGTLKNSEEKNEFLLSKETLELTTERIVTFDKVYIPLKKYKKLEDQNFEVLVNVFSGRKSSQYNILNVELLQKPIDEVKGKRHFLKGGLISEM